MEQQTLFKVRDLRQKTQFKVDDLYLNGYARICGANATLVYLSLCRHAEFESQKAFPSQNKIAFELGISIASVKRGIKKLNEYNIITIEKEKMRGKFNNNIYYLLDKSEWIKNDYHSSFRDTVDHSSKTVALQPPTVRDTYKDNKVLRITNTKDNKEGIITPADEMILFLNLEEFPNEMIVAISEKTKQPESIVKNELLKFRSYWAELNKTGTKQRWEMEKTFELKRRLATWFSKANQFNQRSNQKGKTIYNTLQ